MLSTTKTTNMKECEVCKEKTAYKCMKCDKYVCVLKKKSWNGGKCMVALHNDTFFGLTKSDHKELHNKDVKTWKAASDTTKRRHESYMKTIMELDEMGASEDL